MRASPSGRTRRVNIPGVPVTISAPGPVVVGRLDLVERGIRARRSRRTTERWPCRSRSWPRARDRRAPSFTGDSLIRQLRSVLLRDGSARTARESPRPLGVVGNPRCAYAAAGRDPAARGALEEAALEQERLVHVLDRLGLLAHRDRERGEPHRLARERAAQRGEHRPVDLVETERVDLEQRERGRARSRGRRCRRREPPRSRVRAAATGSRCGACRAIATRSRPHRRLRAAPRGWSPSAAGSWRGRRARSSRAGRRTRSGRAAGR